MVARVFDSGTAENWKADVVAAARSVRPTVPLEGPVRVDIRFLLPRPTSLCRKKDSPGMIWATARPDRDNLEKAVLDALGNDGWWRDDAQIVCGEVAKLYHRKGGWPGALVVVTPLRGDCEDSLPRLSAPASQASQAGHPPLGGAGSRG